MFLHLRARTAYSLLESATPLPALVDFCKRERLPAIGIADTGNLFGALEASDKLAAAGIQPIIGTVLDVVLPSGLGSIALYARDDAGYANLCRLSSEAHLRPVDGRKPSVAISTLADHSEGLLALSGGQRGAIDSHLWGGKPEMARTGLASLLRIFGDRLYVEIQRHGLPGEHDIEADLLQLAYDMGIPIVGTHEALYLTPDDYEAHDALLAIAEGKRVFEDDRRRATKEQWLKPPADMERLFADLPEAIENTVEIARRCRARPKGRKPLLPHVAKDEASELLTKARGGLARRLEAGPADGFTLEDYESRLEYEVGVIAKMGFAGYFLIVADFIGWSKANGIPVGPGRGSGAGSVVAWSLLITDLDPLRFGLLFERFLNPERVSMPDFDIDFCQERRDEVIRYVQQRYGVDRVAQIITHGKLQARAVLRDVGRALSMPYGQVDRICKMVPNNPADPVTIGEAIEAEPQLMAEIGRDETTARLVETAQRLEGLYRHASTHAAGVVIGDRPLHELVPLYRDPKSDFPITQFNWKLVEAAGLVKFDFLGLKTLTVIQKCLQQIERTRGIAIDLARLPLDDSQTYEMLAKADTVGVFQLESSGMRESLRTLKPDRFEDIIAMVALYRPGPMDNIPTYVERKHGREAAEYPHPMLEPILAETHGVIIYQEQVIQIAQTLSGYTLGQADLLRRAMGKKDKDEMAKQRARFVDGAVGNGVHEDLAGEIFDLVDKFAGYGFNKSHAAAYALIAYQTAFLKANYREEFLAASMTLEMSDTDKLALFCREAKRAGIIISPPCVNSGSAEFVAVASSPPAIRYALSGLKNVGHATAAAIAEERRKGPFMDISDFARRMPPAAINKRAIEMLAGSGAFDSLGVDRATAFSGASNIVDFCKREAGDRQKGIMDLFGDSKVLELPDTMEWTATEICQQEYAAIGQYITAHPLDDKAGDLKRLGCVQREALEKMASRGKARGMIGAVCVEAKQKVSKKGNRFAWLTLSDHRGQFESIMFADTLELSKEMLVPGQVLAVEVDVEIGSPPKFIARAVEAI